MRRFVWRLQRVLDIRTKEEQIRRAELFELTEKLAGARSELIFRRKLLDSLIEDLGQADACRRLREQEFFLKYSATIDEQIKNSEKKVGLLEKEQKAKIAEVIEARKRKEVLEKLRTEAKRKFVEEQEKLEQKEMDERTTMSYARKIIEQSFV